MTVLIKYFFSIRAYLDFRLLVSFKTLSAFRFQSLCLRSFIRSYYAVCAFHSFFIAGGRMNTTLIYEQVCEIVFSIYFHIKNYLKCNYLLGIGDGRIGVLNNICGDNCELSVSRILSTFYRLR